MTFWRCGVAETLTFNIDLRDWMDHEVERQRMHHGEKLHKQIADASRALDHYTEDELEEACGTPSFPLPSSVAYESGETDGIATLGSTSSALANEVTPTVHGEP